MKRQVQSCQSWFSILIYLSTLNLLHAIATQREPIVQVLIGDNSGYRGSLYSAEDGGQYWAFRGIRYSEPLQRFEISSRAGVPKGIIDALNDPPVCPQVSIVNNSETIGDEDCLFLNIFTPPLKGEVHSELPIMVFFHGGAFSFGSASWYLPDFLVPEDVILVVPQYRLGALGFLATGDEHFPGNLGLMDQVTALEWIQRYIRYFGGDPQRVTIMGQSAGGASVSLHLLSPMSKGLFSAAISLSGNVMDPWALQDEPSAFAFNLARQLKCSSSEGPVLRTCLQSLTAAEIVRAEQTLKETRLSSGQFAEIAAGPVLQSPHDQRSLPPFLSTPPKEALTTGQVNRVPYLLGTVRDEASGSLSKKYGVFLDKVSSRDLIESMLEQTELSPLAIALAAELIHWEYFGEYVNETASVKFLGASQLASDVFFKKGAHQMAHLYSQWADTYLYSFEHAGQPKLWKLLYPRLGEYQERPVAHNDDLAYLFHPAPVLKHFGLPKNKSEFEYSKQDQEVRQTVVKFWTHFAKTGKPDADEEWSPFSAHAPNTYVIAEKSRLEESLNLQRMRLLNELLPSLSSQVLQILTPTAFKTSTTTTVAPTTEEPMPQNSEPNVPTALPQVADQQIQERGSSDKKSLALNQEEIVVSSSFVQIAPRPLGRPQLLNPSSLRN